MAMKYARQVQVALNNLDNGLLKLNGFIKKGEQQMALKFMEEDLKELYKDLQHMVNLSQTGNIGASGMSNIGAL